MAKKTYSIVAKRRALTCYLITGSFADASVECGIDRRTLSAWSKTDWWAAWEEEVTEELGKRLTAKMRGVALKAYDQINDRLANGDVGTYKDLSFRHPIKAKDLSIIGNVASDKMRLAEGKATTRSEATDLFTAAALFDKIANSYRDKMTQLSGQRPVIEAEAIKVALPGDRA